MPMNQNRRLTVPNQNVPWQEKLIPELAHAYALLPSSMSSPIAGLVTKALPRRIHPNLPVQYAFLRVCAEQQSKGDAVSKDHAIRSRDEMAGELHGSSVNRIGAERSVIRKLSSTWTG